MTFVEDIFVALARLDGCPAMPVTCFSHDGTDKAGGHQQMLYHGTFTKFLFNPYNQLISCIRMFAKVWCAEQLSTCSPRISEAYTSNETSRPATMEIYMPSLRTQICLCLESALRYIYLQNSVRSVIAALPRTTIDLTSWIYLDRRSEVTLSLV